MTWREARVRAQATTARVAHLWVRVGLLVLGVWLTIAPFALAYRPAGAPARATVNDVLCGVLVVALALFSLLAQGSPVRGRDRSARR